MKPKLIEEEIEKINIEIEEIVNLIGNGGGYGDPDARLADDRKLKVLMTKLKIFTDRKLNNNFLVINAKLDKFNTVLATLNIVFVFLNLIIFAYSVFYKK